MSGGVVLRSVLRAVVSSHFGGLPGAGVAGRAPPPGLAWAGAAAPEGQREAFGGESSRGLGDRLSEVLGGIWNMAVPKKKV